MRKLASIQLITNLEPIEGADWIEKATILGWQLVVKKGDFKINDKVVYCEIDSILPDKPEFGFLKSRGMRIRTIRLRGTLSQGICFPLSILPNQEDVLVGKDVTEILGVTKYEPPIPACLSGIIKGTFPSFIPKTDETRVQILQNLLNKYEGERCYITEKIDGSSVTYYIKDGVFGVCSRNMELVEDLNNSYWKVARAMDIENKLRKLNGNFAIQGELYGEGIQENKYRLKGQTAVFFNLFDIDKFSYVSFYLFQSILIDLDIPTVPVVEVNYFLERDIPTLINKSLIRSALNPKIWAEGIVIRPIEEKLDLLLSNEKFNNGRVTFKVINPEFLIGYGD